MPERSFMSQQKKSMFYECVLMIRPDVATTVLTDIVKEIQDIVQKENGSVLASEYWGFRTLCYRIEKRGKAHYICLGLELSCLKELTRHLRFHRDLLRFCFFKRPEGLKFPTSLFQSHLGDLNEHSQVATEALSTQGKEYDDTIDYKNIRLLKRYLTEHGKIMPARLTRLSFLEQRKVASAIKQSRILSLLPFREI